MSGLTNPDSREPTGSFKRSDLYWLVGIAAAALLAHGIALTSGFVWDDLFFLEIWLPRFDSLHRIFFPHQTLSIGHRPTTARWVSYHSKSTICYTVFVR